MELRPFFSYFGGKWRAAPAYPPPQHRTLIEPFAGSAGYALRYPHLDVLLIDKSEAIAGVWEYLINVKSSEVLALPDVPPGERVPESLPQEAQWLIGLWVNQGAAAPRRTQTRWASRGDHHQMCMWGRPARERIAKQVTSIRHWLVQWGEYNDAPDIEATWFVDPPYQTQGKQYPHGAKGIDFGALGEWCKSRRGQVMVCENTGAGWLPFRPFGKFKSNKSNSTRPRSAEALWLNAFPGSELWLPRAS